MISGTQRSIRRFECELLRAERIIKIVSCVTHPMNYGSQSRLCKILIIISKTLGSPWNKVRRAYAKKSSQTSSIEKERLGS